MFDFGFPPGIIRCVEDVTQGSLHFHTLLTAAKGLAICCCSGIVRHNLTQASIEEQHAHVSRQASLQLQASPAAFHSHEHEGAQPSMVCGACNPWINASVAHDWPVDASMHIWEEHVPQGEGTPAEQGDKVSRRGIL